MANVQEAVRRLTIQATAAGVEETTRKVRGLGDSYQDTTVKTQQKERATQSMERRLQSIQNQYDRNFRAQQQMTRIERDLNAAQAQGLITAARKNDLMALAAARHTQAAAAAGTQATALVGLNTQMAATATMARSLFLTLGPIGGLLTVGGLTAGMRGGVADLSEVGKVADRIGLMTEELQGLRYGFKLTGVETSAFDSSVQRLTRTLGEGASKGNDLSKVLEANGIAIRDVDGVISTSQGLRHIADLMANARTESERLALANMAFGRGGMEMANALSKGSEELDRIMVAARAAGVVVEDSVIRRAEDLDDRFTKLTTTIGTWFKRAAVEAADALWGLVDASNRLEQRTHLPSLEGSLRRLEEERDRLQAVMRDMHDRASGLREAAQNYARRQIEATAQDLFKVLDQIALVQGRITMLTTPTPRPEGAPTRLPDSGGGGSSAAARLNEYERTTRNIERQTEAMRVQIETVGMAREVAARYRVEQEMINAAKRAGVQQTPEVLANIRRIAEEYGQTTAELRRLQEQQRELRDMNSAVADFGKGLVRGFMDGKGAVEALSDSLGQLGRRLADLSANRMMKAIETGDLSNFFGSSSLMSGHGALGMLGAGAMGYSSGSPLAGGIGGAMAGASFGPAGMAVGGLLGAIGGLFGSSSRRREEEAARQRAEDQARQQAQNRHYEYAVRAYRPSVDASTMAGRMVMFDFDAEIQRQREAQQGNQSIQALEYALAHERMQILRDFYDDAIKMLSTDEPLSAVAERLGEINVAGDDLRQALVGMGVDAASAAKTAAAHMRAATGNLRESFVDDLTRSVRALEGQGHVNEIADAQKRYNERLSDAASLGVSASLANREFALSLASIASNAGLTGEELREVSKQFGVSSSVVSAAVAEIKTAVSGTQDWSAQIESLAVRRLRVHSTRQTLDAQLRIFDIEAGAERRRLQEAGANAKAMESLELTLLRERQRMIADFNQLERGRYDDLSLRLMRVTTNTDELSGALQIFDRERQLEIKRAKESGESIRNLSALEQALAQERQQIINQFNRRDIDQAKNALDEAMDAFATFSSGLGEFRRSLALGQLSTLSAGDRISEAASEFDRVFADAMSGDRVAMSRLQDASRTYLEQARDYWASGPQYAEIFDAVTRQLREIDEWASGQVSDAEKQLAVLQKQVSGLDAVNDSVLSVADAIAELTQAVSAYLKAGGSASGFSSGGYTGNLPIGRVAGVVHGQEFVMNAAATARWRPQLEAMNAGRGAGVANDNAVADIGRIIASGANAQIAELRELRAGMAELKREMARMATETRIAGEKQRAS